jgi:predicted nucleic acid-binding protein
MTTAQFLVDTSALVRLLRDSGIRRRWQSQITAGVIGVCPITELELLYSARSKSDREELLELIAAAFSWVGMPDRVFTRAAEVQAAMTARGTHRSASAVDLVISATAEVSGLTLLHYDHDFAAVVTETAQPAVWLASPGSIA